MTTGCSLSKALVPSDNPECHCPRCVAVPGVSLSLQHHGGQAQEPLSGKVQLGEFYIMGTLHSFGLYSPALHRMSVSMDCLFQHCILIN